MALQASLMLDQGDLNSDSCSQLFYFALKMYLYYTAETCILSSSFIFYFYFFFLSITTIHFYLLLAQLQ